jgi:hypothetical protein
MIKRIFIIPIFAFALFLTLWVSHKQFCANSISCVRDLSGEYDPTKTAGEYLGQSVGVPLDSRLRGNDKEEGNKVLAATSPAKSKKILVNLTTQQLFAYEGDKLRFKFKISSGKFSPTPVGKFYIWSKLYATQMEGGERENNSYYRLPNVPYVMYFYNENVGKWNGYGIHGMYWYSDFGYPSTNGCIGLKVEDAEKLFYWTDPSILDTATFAKSKDSATPVIIFGKASL